MPSTLRAFIARKCVQQSAAHYPLKQFVADFHGYLQPAARADWPRGRVLKELLREEFLVGTVEKVSQVAGLAPRAEWTEVDGRLELSREVR